MYIFERKFANTFILLQRTITKKKIWKKKKILGPQNGQGRVWPFRIWGPSTIWHNLPSAQFFSLKITPPQKHNRVIYWPFFRLMKHLPAIIAAITITKAFEIILTLEIIVRLQLLLAIIVMVTIFAMHVIMATMLAIFVKAEICLQKYISHLLQQLQILRRQNLVKLIILYVANRCMYTGIVCRINFNKWNSGFYSCCKLNIFHR